MAKVVKTIPENGAQWVPAVPPSIVIEYDDLVNRDEVESGISIVNYMEAYGRWTGPQLFFRWEVISETSRNRSTDPQAPPLMIKKRHRVEVRLPQSRFNNGEISAHKALIPQPGNNPFELNFNVALYNQPVRPRNAVDGDSRPNLKGGDYKRAIVLSGGGAKGAFHVGALKYLYQREKFYPDIVIGTSVGAINGSKLAEATTVSEHLTAVKELEEFWLELRDDRDIYEMTAERKKLELLGGNVSGALSRVGENLAAGLMLVPFGSIIGLSLFADELEDRIEGILVAADKANKVGWLNNFDPLRRYLSARLNVAKVQASAVELRLGTVDLGSGDTCYLDKKGIDVVDTLTAATDPWEKIPGAAVQIAVTPRGKAWVVSETGAIFEYVRVQPGRWDWVRRPGSGRDIGVGADGSVWIVGTNEVAGGYGIYRWNGSGWDTVPGGGVRIAVNQNGNAWVVNSGGVIFEYTGTQWAQRPGKARDIGIGANGSVWMIGTGAVGGGYAVYRWNGSDWDRMPGGGVRISVDPRGNAWLVNENGDIYEFTGSKWRHQSGHARDVGVGADGSVWVIGTVAESGGYGIHRFTLQAFRTESRPGNLIDAILASAGMPLVFPYVASQRSLYTDGGLREVAGLAQALKMGATDIVVIPTYWPSEDGARYPAINTFRYHNLTDFFSRAIIDLTFDEIMKKDCDTLRWAAHNLAVAEGRDLRIRVVNPQAELQGSLDFHPEGIRRYIDYGYNRAATVLGNQEPRPIPHPIRRTRSAGVLVVDVRFADGTPVRDDRACRDTNGGLGDSFPVGSAPSLRIVTRSSLGKEGNSYPSDGLWTYSDVVVPGTDPDGADTLDPYLSYRRQGQLYGIPLHGTKGEKIDVDVTLSWSLKEAVPSQQGQSGVIWSGYGEYRASAQATWEGRDVQVLTITLDVKSAIFSSRSVVLMPSWPLETPALTLHGTGEISDVAALDWEGKLAHGRYEWSRNRTYVRFGPSGNELGPADAGFLGLQKWNPGLTIDVFAEPGFKGKSAQFPGPQGGGAPPGAPVRFPVNFPVRSIRVRKPDPQGQ